MNLMVHHLVRGASHTFVPRAGAASLRHGVANADSQAPQPAAKRHQPRHRSLITALRRTHGNMHGNTLTPPT